MSQKISILKALLYGYGSLMGLGSGLIVSWLLYYYCPPSGSSLPVLAPIAFMGIAILFGRVVDAVSDPLIGYWSDISVTRWGRRRPFIIWGFVFMALSQVFIWRPIVQGYSLWNAIYATLLLGLFWLGFTAAIAPYLALLPEIATSVEDRVKLATYQAFFNQVSLVIGGSVVPILLTLVGFFNTALILTAIATTSMLGIVLVFKEKPLEETKIAKGMGLWKALKITYTNRIFLVYLIPTAILVLSTTMIQMVIPYLVKVSAGLSEADVALFYTPLIISSLASLPLFRTLVRRHGKKKMYLVGMAMLIIPAFLLTFTGSIGVDPRIYLILIGIVVGVAVTPLLMLPNAFIADITDIDEKITGYRREAIYFGSQGFVTKSMAGLAGVLTSLFLETFGYSPGADMGIRLTTAFSAIIIIAAALIFTRYPLEK
jgi:GPH family glycoside/pentoside/hexuronide:cation symporter